MYAFVWRLYLIVDKLRKESIFYGKPGVKINNCFLYPAEITWLWMSVQQLAFPVHSHPSAMSLCIPAAETGKDDTYWFSVFCLVRQSLMRTLMSANTWVLLFGFGLEGTLKIIWFQPPCHGQGHLPPHQVAQSPIQPSLEHCQGGGSHSFSGPGLHHPHSEEFLPCI